MCGKVFAFVCLHFGLFYSVAAADDDSAPRLQIVANPFFVCDVGEKKAIYCEGTNLKHEIEWYNPGGARVGPNVGPARVYETRQPAAGGNLKALMFQTMALSDSGNWTCRAGDLEETVYIVVGVKVVFDPRVEHQEVEERHNARLSCVARGTPPLAVYWYKDNVPVQVDNKKYALKVAGDNHQLEVRRAAHSDAAEYTCKATQEQLSYYTDKRIVLTVHHKPVFVDALTEEVVEQDRTVELYALMNETKNITCKVKASPEPTFKWTRQDGSLDKSIIEEDTIFTEGATSVLQLRLYNESALGRYRCRVENDKGVINTVFDVSVGNKPAPPDFVQLVNTSLDTFFFNVTCQECKFEDEEGKPLDPTNLKVLGYVFQFVPFLEGFLPNWDNPIAIPTDITSPGDTVFSVGPLPNATTFHGRVSSRNAAGLSEWLDISPNPATTDAGPHHLARGTLVLLALCSLWVSVNVE